MTGTIIPHDPKQFSEADVADIVDSVADDFDEFVSVELLAKAFVMRAIQVLSHHMTPEAARQCCDGYVEDCFAGYMELLSKEGKPLN